MFNGYIGSDPEVFATNGKRTANGTPIVVPAFDALGGDIELELPYGKAYCDGAAIEFDVHPHSSGAMVARRLFQNLDALRNYVAEKGLELTTDSYGYVGRQQINRFPEFFGKRASLQILGCSADFSAYREELPQRPDPKTFEYRTLGGHIHLELPDNDEYRSLRFSRLMSAAMDSTVGTVITALCQSPLDLQRKQLYGLSGTYRRPAHGFEYRTPPARALLTDQHLTEILFSMGACVRDYLIEEIGPNASDADYTTFVRYLGGVDAVLEVSESIDKGVALTETPFSKHMSFDVERTISKYSPLFSVR